VNFFNIDLHISVIADINNIFQQLGHSVDINYLSNHCWVFNKQPNNSFCVNQFNWQSINPEMCDRFYKENKEKLDKYDGFIVTHIPAISLLYEKFNKPIIFVSSTRYEYPFTNYVERWQWFNNYINENKNIIPISNNLYDKWYCEQFTKREFQHIPSLCEYTNSKYLGRNGKNLLSSKYVNINHPEIVNKNLIGRYDWKDLSDYRSIIHIPYNVSTMTIFENYTSNIPLLFPSKRLTLELSSNNLTMSELSYNQVLGLNSKSTIDFSDVIDPNDFKSTELINKAIELSDFYNDNMREIITFDNPNELFNLINNLDFNEISLKMKNHNIERKESIINDWKKILQKL
jgi:hypothetical protein